MCACVCVCVCVREKERERERQRGGGDEYRIHSERRAWQELELGKGSTQRRQGCNRHGSLVVSKQLSNFNETRLFLRDSVSVLWSVFV